MGRLAKLALYLKPEDYQPGVPEEMQPEQPLFVADRAPVAPHHSRPGVCDALGRLVTSGVLPALAQARLLFPSAAPVTYTSRGLAPAPSSCMQRHLIGCVDAAGPAVPMRKGS